MNNRGKSLIVGKLQFQVEGTVWRGRWLEKLRESLEQWEQSGLGTKNWNHLWETLRNSLGKGYSPSAVWAPVSSPSGNQISSNSISQVIPVCCSLSWDQECSLQWFAAVLFLAPQGRDSSVNHFSICLNLPEHPWVWKAWGTCHVSARLRGGFRLERVEKTLGFFEGGKRASPWRVWGKELRRDGAFGRNPGELRKTARGCCSRPLLSEMINMKVWSQRVGR